MMCCWSLPGRRSHHEDQLVTSDDPSAPVEGESRPPRDVPLVKMWTFGAVGGAFVIAALALTPKNPAGWLGLASLAFLGWFTRAELRRRKTAGLSENDRSHPL